MTSKILISILELTKILESYNIDNNIQNKILQEIKKKYIETTLNGKKNLKRDNKLTDYTKATSKSELKERMSGADLKKILALHNKNKNGSKENLAARVWWILNPNTQPPDNLEVKKRGRPSVLKKNGPAFIDDSSDEDDDKADDPNIDEYFTLHKIPRTWNKIYIDNNHTISTSGKVLYQYKKTDYIFKKTLDQGFIPYGSTNEHHTVTIIGNHMSPELQQIINNIS